MRHTQIFANAEVRHPLLTEAHACEFLRRSIEACKMRVIGGPWAVIGTVPGNEGVSATAILDYSSASIHEWTAPVNLVTLDIFTCGRAPKWADIAAVFANLEPINLRISIIDRERFFD